jgi:hypothetical protein
MKNVKIEISGYGGEHTIGKLTTEQAHYWLDKDEDELETHVCGFDDEEHDHPIDDWSSVDDVDHTYGCIITNQIYIRFGDDPGRTFPDTNDFYKEEINSIQYENMELDTPHLICFSEDKGEIISGEFEVDDNEVFNIVDFMLITKNILGDIFVVGIKYKGEVIEITIGDGINKGFSASIVYPADEVDE